MKNFTLQRKRIPKFALCKALLFVVRLTGGNIQLLPFALLQYDDYGEVKTGRLIEISATGPFRPGRRRDSRVHRRAVGNLGLRRATAGCRRQWPQAH